MERTEAGGRLKSIRGIWQNQPPMGFYEENKYFWRKKTMIFTPTIVFGFSPKKYMIYSVNRANHTIHVLSF